MKDSKIAWIGEIPDTWEIKKLGELCTLAKSGGTPSSKNDNFYCNSGEGTPWVSIGDMSNRDEVYETAKDVTQEGIRDKKLTIYPVGTLLYSMYASLGHVAELMVPATVNQAILAIQLNTNIVNKGYVKQVLKAYQPHVYEKASNNTQANLNMSKVLDIDIPVPPLSEQERIASYLDEKARQATLLKHSDLITQLKQYKQSLISEYVTGKKRVGTDDIGLKDSGISWIGEIPSNWSVVKLGDLCEEIKNGTTIKQVGIDTGYKVTRIETIANRTVNYDKVGHVEYEEKLDKYKLQKYDILLSHINSLEHVGKTAMYLGEQTLYHGMNLLRLRANKSIINPIYLLFVLRTEGVLTSIKQLSKRAVNQVSVSIGNLSTIDIPVPPLSEQKLIADKLDVIITEIDGVVLNSERMVGELKAYKSAIITEFITGQRLVPGAVDTAERERERERE